MKKIILLALLLIVIAGSGMLTQFPWWSFTIPVFVMGILLPLKKWKVLPFIWGFIAGFLVWTGATLYFGKSFEGAFMDSAAHIGKVSSLVMYVVIGLIGGTLAGLALYSGYLLRKGSEVLRLELPKE